MGGHLTKQVSRHYVYYHFFISYISQTIERFLGDDLGVVKDDDTTVSIFSLSTNKIVEEFTKTNKLWSDVTEATFRNLTAIGSKDLRITQLQISSNR